MFKILEHLPYHVLITNSLVQNSNRKVLEMLEHLPTCLNFQVLNDYTPVYEICKLFIQVRLCNEIHNNIVLTLAKIF